MEDMQVFDKFVSTISSLSASDERERAKEKADAEDNIVP
jgi:hypothetical protein